MTSKMLSIAEFNKQQILRYFHILFNKKNPTEAVEKFIGTPYIQHNPCALGGTEHFINMFKNYFLKYPDFEAEIKKIISDDHYVFIHVLVKKYPNDLGQSVVDMYRLENGLIVEHWDVIQSIPKNKINPNDLF